MKNARKTPPKRLDLGQVLENAVLFTPQPCIYYLINSRNEFIYVGQTMNLREQLLAHRDGGIQFVRFKFFPCEVSELDRLQQAAITRLKPVLNKPSKPKSTLGNLSKPLICLKYNITPIAFERLRETFGLHPVSLFGKVKYYKAEDVEAWVKRFKGLVVSGRHVLQAMPTYMAVGISSRTKQIQLYTKQ